MNNSQRSSYSSANRWGKRDVWCSGLVKMTDKCIYRRFYYQGMVSKRTIVPFCLHWKFFQWDRGFIMADIGMEGNPRWTWHKRSGVPEAYTLKPSRPNCKKPVWGSMMQKISWILSTVTLLVLGSINTSIKSFNSKSIWEPVEEDHTDCL